VNGNDLRLGVVVPERNVITESFIRAHIEGLYENTIEIWGSPRPLFHGEGTAILPAVGSMAAKALVFGLGLDSLRASAAVARRTPTSQLDRSLADFLQQSRVDVVLAEYGPTGVEVMNACERARTPLVTHFHGYDAYHSETLDRFRDAYRQLFDRCYRLVAVSHHMVDQLVELGASPDRVTYIPYGVDTVSFDGGRPGAVPPLFLALGRFVEKKAPELTLDAFSVVHADEPRSRLVMLGDGPLRVDCIEHVRSLGIGSAVQFPGSVNHDAVVVWMQKARCFVQHSRRAANGDCEGTPLAILEASSCGLPVVSTRHAGIPEAVREGEGGFLVEEGDVDGMADRMLRLARDPDLAATMGAVGRAHVKAHYSSEKSLGNLRTTLVEAALDLV
jgi:glycosyltransferase involved in cell wall biosynthesis